MDLPDAPRVIYEPNPLDEVVCQLKFPAILRIEADGPVAFQEAVRNDYPLYQIDSTIKLPAGVPMNLAKLLERELPAAGTRTHAFSSPDRVWTLKLSRDAVTLTCKRYERWEPFRDRLTGMFDALVRIYPPPFFNHVCLRYRDVIRPSKLGLGEEPWSAWLQPWICGPLAQPGRAANVESIQSRAVFRLPESQGRVDVSYGIAIEQPSKENVFLIDSHLYNEQQTAGSDVFQRLAVLNRQAGRFFRSCITDRLHGAMRPREIPPS